MEMRGILEKEGAEFGKIEVLTAAGIPDPVVLGLIQISCDFRKVLSFSFPEFDVAIR